MRIPQAVQGDRGGPGGPGPASKFGGGGRGGPGGRGAAPSAKEQNALYSFYVEAVSVQCSRKGTGWKGPAEGAGGEGPAEVLGLPPRAAARASFATDAPLMSENDLKMIIAVRTTLRRAPERMEWEHVVLLSVPPLPQNILVSPLNL